MIANTSATSVISLSFEAFTRELSEAQARWIERRPLLEALIDAKPLLLFGFGGKGQTLAHQIRNLSAKAVTVFDTSPDKRRIAQAQGFTVIETLLPEQADTWATILGACQAQSEQKLDVPQNHIYFQEAATLFNVPSLGNLAQEYGAYVLPNARALYDVYAGLHEDSRRKFLAILKFRLSSDPTDVASVKCIASEMWLDVLDEHRHRPYTTVLDVGAFDGDTLRAFRNRFACVRGIAVEANQTLFDSIREVGAAYPDGINIMPMAAWSTRTRLRFDEVRFGMIQVTESNEGELEAAPIDDFVAEQVDCVKMDIEGAESQALRGCQHVLTQWQPDLAIAAYHKPDDFVRLFAELGDAGYRGSHVDWHIGHYSDCLDDSIYYVTRT